MTGKKRIPPYGENRINWPLGKMPSEEEMQRALDEHYRSPSEQPKNRNEDDIMAEMKRLSVEGLETPSLNMSTYTGRPLTKEFVTEAIEKMRRLHTELQHSNLASMRIVVSSMATYVSTDPVQVYRGNLITRLFPKWWHARHQDKLNKRFGFIHKPTMFIVNPSATAPKRSMLDYMLPPYIIVHPALEMELRKALYSQRFDEAAEWLATGLKAHHGSK